jgi:hypothetical protein
MTLNPGVLHQARRQADDSLRIAIPQIDGYFINSASLALTA